MGGSFAVMLSVIGSFFLMQYLEKRKIEHAELKRKEEQRNYEERYRQGMNRIRQNLKLDHFLAAYRNFQLTPTPPEKDPYAREDYLDVVNRIGQGLLKSQNLKEAEEVFSHLRDFEGQRDGANESIGRIESRRRLESARLLFMQVEKFIEQNRFQDALGDLKKVEQELNSVENLKFDEIQELWERYKKLTRLVKFRVFADDADRNIKEAARFLKGRNIRATESAMSRAANLTGKAAFFNPDSDEVKSLRHRLFELDAELAIIIPNELPVTNKFTKEMNGRLPYFFYLDGYEFDISKVKSDNLIKIGLKFFLQAPESYFIVRYKVYYYDNQDSFNGHFLTEQTALAPSKDDTIVRAVEYLQEIPERLRSTPVKRIEVKVFNDKDQLVSQVTRAFRRDG